MHEKHKENMTFCTKNTNKFNIISQNSSTFTPIITHFSNHKAFIIIIFNVFDIKSERTIHKYDQWLVFFEIFNRIPISQSVIKRLDPP